MIVFGGNDLEKPSTENIKETLTALSSIENKIAGTPNEKRAMEYVAERLRDYGFDNIESSTFKVFGWNPVSCKVRITKPVRRTLKASLFPYSQSASIKGDLVSVKHLNDERNIEDSGEIGVTPWGGHTYLSPNRNYYRALKQGLKALLIATPDEGDLRKVVVVESGRPLKIPVISISKEDGRHLMGLLEKGRVMVEIETEVETPPDAESMNLEVRIGGQVDTSHEISIGTHVDSWFVGATKSASVAILLELARLLDQHVRKGGVIKRRVRLLFFGALECGAEGFYHWCIGSRVWVEEHASEIEKIAAMLSLESIGFPKPAQRVLVATYDLLDYVKGLPVNREASLKTEYLEPPPTYGSDHWFFQISGVPSINGISYPSPLHHTQKDDLEHLDYEAVQYFAEFLLEVVLDLVNRNLMPIDLYGTLERFYAVLSKYKRMDSPFDIESLLLKMNKIRINKSAFKKALKAIASTGDEARLSSANDFLVSSAHLLNRTIGWLWRADEDTEYHEVGYLSRLELIEDYIALNAAITSLRSTPLGVLGSEHVERMESQPDNPFNWMFIHEPLSMLEKERSRVFKLIDEEIHDLSGILDRLEKGISDIIGG
jgi:Iap family predicted aminopeptidase